MASIMLGTVESNEELISEDERVNILGDRMSYGEYGALAASSGSSAANNLTADNSTMFPNVLRPSLANGGTTPHFMLPEDEQPLMGVLGFGVVTFGTATCIFCILANTMVLIDVRRDIISSSSLSHKTHQLFHVTQTVIDFLLGILIMPIHVLIDSHLIGDWLFTTSICRIWYAFDVALCTAAIWNQYISCLDKYWCVTSPTTYVGKKRRSRIKQMFRILGLLAFGIGSPVLFDCNLADNAIYAFYSTLASFWVPMITLLTLSFRSYMFRKSLLEINKKASVFASPVLLARGLVQHMSAMAKINRAPSVNKSHKNKASANEGIADPTSATTTTPLLADLGDQSLKEVKVTPATPPFKPRRMAASQSMPVIGLKRQDNYTKHNDDYDKPSNPLNGVCLKIPSPPKRPVGLCVRHYIGRDNMHISAIRQASSPLGSELTTFPNTSNSHNFNDKPLDNDGWLNSNHNDGHPSLRTLLSSDGEQLPLLRSGSTRAASKANGGIQREADLIVDLIMNNRSRRVRFDVERARQSVLTTTPARNGEKTGGAGNPMTSRFSSPSPTITSTTTASPLSSASQHNLPGSNNHSLPTRSPSYHNALQEGGDYDDIEQYPRRSEHETNKNGNSSGENKVETVVDIEHRHHPQRHHSRRVDNVNEVDEEGHKLMFFRRLRAFVNSTLHPNDDRLSLEVYWRQCNVNEHYIYSTAIVLGVCWGPFFIMYAIGLFFKIESSQKIIRLLLWFGYFNSALNPALIPILTRFYES